MSAFRAPRGTRDILPEEQHYWDYVTSVAESVCLSRGYGRIETPIFEDSRLFLRGVGEGTDIVEKEMYIFEDREVTRWLCVLKVQLPYVGLILNMGWQV